MAQGIERLDVILYGFRGHRAFMVTDVVQWMNLNYENSFCSVTHRQYEWIA
jgi:hypothetical protein